MNPFDKKESDTRKKQFLEAYDELVKKYQVELLAMPQYVPSGQHGFNTSIVMIPIDKKDRPVPSPLQDGPIIK